MRRVMVRVAAAVACLLVTRPAALPGFCPEAGSAQCDVAREVTLLQAKLDLKTAAKQPARGAAGRPGAPLVVPKPAHLPVFPRVLVPNVAVSAAEDEAAFQARTTDCDAQIPQVTDSIGSLLPVPELRATDNTSVNLCNDFHDGNGTAAPLLGTEVWILGAAKAGTSSMAADFAMAGIRSNVYPSKESHMYDLTLLMSHPDIEMEAERLKQELEHESPPCPLQRTILGEFTPDNLRNIWLPETLQRMYSPSYLSRIKFIVLVREPLDRLTSGFFFRHEINHDPGTVPEYIQYVTNVLQRGWEWNGEGNPNVEIDFRLWQSMYGGQLRRWLAVGAPDQFYIVPKGHYFSGFKAAMFEELGKWMKVELRLEGEEAEEESHMNRTPGAHHDPNELLPAEMIQSFNKLVEPDVELFVDLMAKGSTQGMLLGNYSGQAGDKVAIDSWLRTGW